MAKKSGRIAATIAAIVLGLLIVIVIVFAGNKTRGPLENLFVSMGTMVKDVEHYFILQKRENKRENKLAWFSAYKHNLNSLKHPSMILLGTYDNETTESFESIINLEDSLHTTLPLIHLFTAWGSKPEQQFPKLQVETILALGSLPIITWEPWLVDFDEEEIPNLRPVKERDMGGLADVATGIYDTYIVKWAKEVAAMNQPLFLRIGHEMNDPYRYPWGPQNNEPEDFIAAWMHIHNLFDSVGATKVIWIWSPHPAYGYYEFFYPGDDMVDYVGVTALNYGAVANWSQWWSFDEIAGNYYPQLAAFNKPIMISEFGSLAVGGDRSAWYANAIRDIPVKYPLVKSLIFFHFSSDNTTTEQTLNWYFIDDKETTRAIFEQLSLWPDSLKPE
ncbi:MAG: cellulase [Bacteroidales bacterium]|nr:cellulase [Bacteroidales bacterium]